MKNSPLPRPGFDFFIHRFDFIFGLVAAEAGPIFPLFHQLPPPQVFRNAFSGVGRAFRRKSGDRPNASTEALIRNDEEEEEKASPLFWVESTKHSKIVFRCVKICSQEKKEGFGKTTLLEKEKESKGPKNFDALNRNWIRSVDSFFGLSRCIVILTIVEFLIAAAAAVVVAVVVVVVVVDCRPFG